MISCIVAGLSGLYVLRICLVLFLRTHRERGLSQPGRDCRLLVKRKVISNARGIPREVPQRGVPPAILGGYVQDHEYDRLFYHGDWP
jgi:hypothetical protein